MSKVVVVPCDNYDEEKVYEAICRGVNELGGIEKFAEKEEKILVKPNFLASTEKDRPITTHQSVIKGFLRLLQENDYKNVKWGDSPAIGGGNVVAASMGLRAEELFGATFAPMNEEVHIKNPGGIIAKDFYFTKDAAEADAIFNLCKMKTHALMGITGAVKNTFGLICGKRKGISHVLYPEANKFAKMLVDIQLYARPRLHIMDAVVAMEGNGPASGDPVDVGLLLFSEDPVAIDTLFCWLIDIDEKRILTNVHGSRMGLGTASESEIEIALADENGTTNITKAGFFEKFGKSDFKIDFGKVSRGLLATSADIMKRTVRKPKIDEKNCIKCGKCVEACPVEGSAVLFKKGKDKAPVHDYKKCIRCYCCQEVCPRKAIYVKKLFKK